MPSFSPTMANPPPTPTFHPFPCLPPELRLKIWRLTLPGVGPSLCAFPAEFPGIDKILCHYHILWNISPGGEFKLNLHDERIIHPLPAAARACREARASILRFAASSPCVCMIQRKEQKEDDLGFFFPLIDLSDVRKYLLVRPAFDSARDVLYFRNLQWMDNMRIGLDELRAHLTLAVPELALKQDRVSVLRLLEAGSLLHIVDSSVNPILQGSREICTGQGGYWKLNVKERRFDFTSGQDGGKNEKLDKEVQDLVRDCIERGMTSAEIRYVVIVPRARDGRDFKEAAK
ncbi:hypothetical protein K461DRAFT_65710 [Myriangium duriaei CBS 260.36]|uniref:2EXR domain-containing protein n=1 Tax=Myriangium duriaei CBS 260.36 TaxID=1168546 RepID=A0A9P4IXA2_9PEZI|nr:hypothetical protein K461DRAFT_65710 [Myriangium duriaei CBS 260.36]